ncbi:hypothetical protein Clacol_003352 [Clathrus columnatus]|uniref:Uncharacterized protein n=1 Tax=Clathrus columnatus TaxID=1419009 RepID=A0AAV5AB27_9AGAM|nr:hypothetical protein Clacol_003352 [Clathrus columnatus]
MCLWANGVLDTATFLVSCFGGWMAHSHLGRTRGQKRGVQPAQLAIAPNNATPTPHQPFPTFLFVDMLHVHSTRSPIEQIYRVQVPSPSRAWDNDYNVSTPIWPVPPSEIL